MVAVGLVAEHVAARLVAPEARAPDDRVAERADSVVAVGVGWWRAKILQISRETS
jgi:hypothetical protein